SVRRERARGVGPQGAPGRREGERDAPALQQLLRQLRHDERPPARRAAALAASRGGTCPHTDQGSEGLDWEPALGGSTCPTDGSGSSTSRSSREGLPPAARARNLPPARTRAPAPG